VKKNIIISVLAAILLVVAIVAVTGCGQGDVTETIKISSTKETGQPKNEQSKTPVYDNKNNVGDQKVDPTKPDTPNQEIPKDPDPEKKPSDANRQSPIIPLSESQLIAAMKLIPLEAFDVSTTEGFCVLNYANQKDCFKRMKYDFNSSADIEKIAVMSPVFLYEQFKAPLNDFERPKNWIWTVTNLNQATFWMAGNFGLNMNLTPMLKKDKYKQYPLEYFYSYYLAPEEITNPRYTKFVVPIADSFAMMSYGDVAALARKTVVNISEKGIGMMADPEYSKFISYMGEPEACALTKYTKGSGDFLRAIESPEAEKMPKEARASFEAVKNKLRPITLKFIGVGFYPEEDYALRFTLYYENAQELDKDLPVLQSVWNNKTITGTEQWRVISKYKEARFLVKDNLCFIECKVDNSIPGIEAINNLSMLLASNGITPLMKQ
jgi:hypothetical protein